MDNFNKGIKWGLFGLAGLLIVTALLFGGYRLGQEKEKSKEEKEQSEKSEEIKTPTPTIPPISPTPTPDPTADWKTYRGKYFEFKYPSTPKEPSIKAKPDQYTLWSVYVYRIEPYYELSVEVSVKSPANLVAEMGTGLDSKSIIIDGVGGTKYTGYSGVAGSIYVNRVFMVKGGLTYAIYTGGLNDGIFDQILSTFKFLD